MFLGIRQETIFLYNCVGVGLTPVFLSYRYHSPRLSNFLRFSCFYTVLSSIPVYQELKSRQTDYEIVRE